MNTAWRAACGTCGKFVEVLVHVNDHGNVVALETFKGFELVGGTGGKNALYGLQCPTCIGKGGTLVMRRPDNVRALQEAATATSKRLTKASFLATLDRLHQEQGGRYYVSLADIRDAHPHVPRNKFDAVLQELRKDWVVTASPAEGRHEKLTQRVLDAGIPEGGRNLVYVSRREE